MIVLNLFSKKYWHVICITGIIALSYAPVCFIDYAFMDDYTIYAEAISAHCFVEYFAQTIQNGRPLQYLTLYPMLKLCDTVEAFSYFRGISIALICLFSVLLYYFFTYANVLDSKCQRIILASAMGLTPSMQVYAAWAISYSYPLSLLLAGVSYITLFTPRIRSFVLRITLSYLSLFAAFAVIQPSAMSFLYFVFIDNCLRSDQYKNYKKLSLAGTVLCCAMISELILVKVIPKLILGYTSQRTELCSSYIDKIMWFIR